MSQPNKISPRLMRIDEVIAKTGLKRGSLYEALKHDNFPQPVKLARRSVAWVEAEIDDWINARIAARRAM